MPEVKPCPFCGQTGKIWIGKDMGPEFTGMDAISHTADRLCPGYGMHSLKRWNARSECN
jgi:hypothetical protein